MTNEPPEGRTVFPFSLQLGDRWTDEDGQEWEILHTPEIYEGGKMVGVRPRAADDPARTDVRHWPSYYRITVRRPGT